MAERFQRYAGNPILTAADWPYPANAVFNPGATRYNGEVLLLVRVEDFQGISHLTAARSPDGRGGWRVDPEPTLVPDPLRHPEEFWGVEDPRIVFLEEEGLYAVTYVAYSRGGPWSPWPRPRISGPSTAWGRSCRPRTRTPACSPAGSEGAGR